LYKFGTLEDGRSRTRIDCHEDGLCVVTWSKKDKENCAHEECSVKKNECSNAAETIIHYVDELTGWTYIGGVKSGIISGYGISFNSNGAGREYYDGMWKNGKRHGCGVLTTADGCIFDGNWIDDKEHGKGTYVMKAGGCFTTFTGDFRSGLEHGNGLLLLHDGSMYKGNWSQGMPNGQGHRLYSNGNMYTGKWKDGRRHGTGIFKWKDADQRSYSHTSPFLKVLNGDEANQENCNMTYNGDFENDVPHGNGVLTYPSGDIYEGSFEYSEFHGVGIMTYKDGSEYSGAWKHSKCHGVGVYIFTGGNNYVGDFECGVYHGNGKMVHVTDDGQVVYDGQWVRGEKNGYGVCTYSNGVKFQGEWSNGFKHGRGTTTSSDGHTRESIWDRDIELNASCFAPAVNRARRILVSRRKKRLQYEKLAGADVQVNYTCMMTEEALVTYIEGNSDKKTTNNKKKKNKKKQTKINGHNKHGNENGSMPCKFTSIIGGDCNMKSGEKEINGPVHTANTPAWFYEGFTDIS